MGDNNDKISILAISGSLRNNSYNTALLRSAVELAPDDTTITLYDRLDEVPNFDPLAAGTEMPEAVKDFRTLLEQADGVIVSTPEYAYGISGVLKNALDWVVATGELVMKPVVVTSVSTSELGGARAHYALLTVLHAMNARVLVEASLNIPFASSKFDANGKLRDELSLRGLENSLRHLQTSIGYDQALS
jgi:NAD(P)H-dependent FMN reductase